MQAMSMGSPYGTHSPQTPSTQCPPHTGYKCVLSYTIGADLQHCLSGQPLRVGPLCLEDLEVPGGQKNKEMGWAGSMVSTQPSQEPGYKLPSPEVYAQLRRYSVEATVCVFFIGAADYAGETKVGGLMHPFGLELVNVCPRGHLMCQYP